MHKIEEKPVADKDREFLVKKSRQSPVEIMAEIDEFFLQAEKREAKRFAEKFNYDVDEDVPLEGRYQWIQLKQ